MVSLFLLLGCNLSYIVVLFAALHELASASARTLLKLASSVRALLRWPNTVFARALADAIQRAHKDCKNKHAVDTAIILFAQFPLYLCYFSS